MESTDTRVPRAGADDAATTRNAASSDPPRGTGPGATHPQPNEKGRSPRRLLRMCSRSLDRSGPSADQYLELANGPRPDFENYRKRAAPRGFGSRKDEA